jgi:hypothetical protein
VKDVLQNGTRDANIVAQATVEKVKKRIGLFLS